MQKMTYSKWSKCFTLPYPDGWVYLRAGDKYKISIAQAKDGVIFLYAGNYLWKLT